MQNETHHTATRVDYKHSLLLLAAFIGGLYFAQSNPMPGSPDEQAQQAIAKEKGHQCNWEDCEMIGMNKFKTECEEGTDCYYFGLTHFEHPEWSYEEVEVYVFGEQVPQQQPLTSIPL